MIQRCGEDSRKRERERARFPFLAPPCPTSQVMIDNFLPILEEEERLAFTCSSNEGELWPSLLEKACAKVHGSYYALEGGSVDDALVDLTGGVSVKTDLSRPEAREMIESGQMWRQVR